ncbi:hypothetical protein DITRI_Ditri01bG0197800 [Diplodiscus trichospermus]
MQQNELGSDDDFKHNYAFQLQHSSSDETNQAAPTAGDGSSLETETGAEHDGSSIASQSAGDTELVSKPTAVSETITTALANTGYTLEGAEVKLALNPLRLAFETKNLMNKALSKLILRSILLNKVGKQSNQRDFRLLMLRMLASKISR